ncbi:MULTISPECIES: hypothetical protein [unclassified Rhodococcus (in: high G+C Gram-positive bacteria)]|jgi:hypothetical protein|uniref:hypothetical protein n=1 Tax=unclassified Rhodococcus (in: high G+C Gram-positive bacteria) TaxID=192944 RepID=UPI00146B815D|nr:MULTISPECIES: hypothetical protein [unclassified Rhodococcus (in: high G+C Gram-positive bacteria)]MBF0662782.1 hypothetical protein [Rhodococcus sp. (in: high G+C Gram-positive bacteria)]NMD95342.1 hypothetical protein [Rhodococcus sp. BL-253-APC-6A1W]NME79790.1 hypothetical protein [Rhodococcus sp. 105337]
MFWKIVGMVALVWVGLAVIGALFDHLFGILVLSAIIFGGYLLYKAMSRSDRDDHVTRF